MNGLPPGRRPWSKGEVLKRELALAYVAYRMLEHKGEAKVNAATKLVVAPWKRRA